jgi:osmotically-inducible protein OsmY
MKRLMEDSLSLLVGAGLGLGAMYLFDPKQGPKRRRYLRQSAEQALGGSLDTAHDYWDTSKDYVSSAIEHIGDSLSDLKGYVSKGAAAGAASKGVKQAREYYDDASKAGGSYYRRWSRKLGDGYKSVKEQARKHTPDFGRKDDSLDASSIVSAAAGAVACLAIGAGVMYLLDPQGGARRRKMIGDKAGKYARESSEFVRRQSQDAYNRGKGVVAETARKFRADTPDDRTIVERVRAHLGRVAPDIGQIHVAASHGTVTLSGQIPADQMDSILEEARKVEGVRSVDSQLQATAG